jgi:hypothetical protein
MTEPINPPDEARPVDESSTETQDVTSDAFDGPETDEDPETVSDDLDSEAPGPLV